MPTGEYIDYNIGYSSDSSTNIFIGYSASSFLSIDADQEWCIFETKPPQRKPKIGEQLMMFEL